MKKLSKQSEQEQNRRYEDHLEDYQLGEGRGRMGEKVQGLRSIIGRYKIDGDVKNRIGNGDTKELTCTIHKHELRWNLLEGRAVLCREGQREKKLGQL